MFLLKTYPQFMKTVFGLLIALTVAHPVSAQGQQPAVNLTPGVPNLESYQISSERFITDEEGNILMYVNVWGHVNQPGNHLVYDGIDMATLLSVVGGPKSGANLKKVRLYREIPDSSGQTIYEIDMEQFLKEGDRSDFVKIKPNDTIIIPQTPLNYVLSQVGILNTFLSMANLYVNIIWRASLTN